VSRRITLVVNPSSGKGRAQEMLPHVAGRFRDAGLDMEILLSRDFAEARQMTHHAVADGADVLAMMGGDGMMHLGVNTCASQNLLGGHPTALGLIPAGTGNDLCRGVGLDPTDPVAAAGVIAAGRTEPIDVMRVNAHFVGTVLATGFDALVNGRANALRWPKGSMRYPLATLAELRVFSALNYRLTVDGQTRELEAMVVAIGNTCFYGGGMRVCPQADPIDGLLDVTIIHPISRVKMLRLLPLMYSGRFAKDRCVEQLQAREISVEGPGLVGYGDGELISAAPLRVNAVVRAVPLCVP
jgi:diacylglycerol kinase (ATP)